MGLVIVNHADNLPKGIWLAVTSAGTAEHECSITTEDFCIMEKMNSKGNSSFREVVNEHGKVSKESASWAICDCLLDKRKGMAIMQRPDCYWDSRVSFSSEK